jgi:acyl-ACP thioesterase
MTASITESSRTLGKNLYANIKAFREERIEEFALEENDLNWIVSYGLSKKNMTNCLSIPRSIDISVSCSSVSPDHN